MTGHRTKETRRNVQAQDIDNSKEKSRVVGDIGKVPRAGGAQETKKRKNPKSGREMVAPSVGVLCQIEKVDLWFRYLNF